MIKPDRPEESDAMTVLLCPKTILAMPMCREYCASCIVQGSSDTGPSKIIMGGVENLVPLGSLQTREGHGKVFPFKLTRWIHNQVYIYNTQSGTMVWVKLVVV
jgi:hypothetical protein